MVGTDPPCSALSDNYTEYWLNIVAAVVLKCSAFDNNLHCYPTFPRINSSDEAIKRSSTDGGNAPK